MKNTACMYLRLSREDGDSSESNSISNQRQIIRSYAKENDIKLSYEYVDDGFSGSNFERPHFKNMIDDLNKGKFNIIIVKDLSRFGRDYIESGKYLQKIFPEKGVRFISVNDNYDSENADMSDTHLILPIRNFINDSYCRDISMKVKSSKEVKRKNGEFIGAFAPFGYKKDDKDKHKLVIDKEVSHIIERIFNMKIEGYSSKAIADFLNSIGTITPSKHKENNGDNFNTGFVVKNAKWDAKMINRIISNKVYIGVLEQGKTTKLNYKSKKEIDVSKEDWIVIQNAHEPIISKSIYLLANKMLLRDVKQAKDKPCILSGMLYCKDCGSPMVRRKVKAKDGYNIFYICSEYNNTGDCSRHSIKEEYIIKATIHALNDYLSKYNELLEKVGAIDISKLTLRVDFDSLNAEKKKYERLRQSLYMDLEEELITTEEFEKFRNNYLIKIREIEKQIITKQNIVEELKDKINDKMKNEYNIIVPEVGYETIRNILTQNFATGTAKTTYKDVVIMDDDWYISQQFNQLLNNEEFKNQVIEVVDYAVNVYKKEYSKRYLDTDLCLYKKYTYEDVCQLLNWEKSLVPLNIGGYYYDKRTNTLPVFINYDKEENIADTIKYHDHFIDPQRLIAMSKSKMKLGSAGMENFEKSKQRNTFIHIFVRKNKDDKISKEFYYLGKGNIVDIRQDSMANGVPVCEIEYVLDKPVRKDIYDFIMN